MRRRSKRYAAGAVLTGIATLVTIVLMGLRTESVKPFDQDTGIGFSRAMLWFELVETPQELLNILGPFKDPTGQHIRAALDTANEYDFAFLTCYSLYNIGLIFFVTHLNRHRFRTLLRLRTFFILGVLLSVGMFVGDLIENFRLLDLTKVTTSDAVSPAMLESLHYWTRVKWGSIGIACLMLCAGYVAHFERIPPLAIPAIYAIAGVSILFAISEPDLRWVAERISLPMISLSWFISFLHASIVLVFGPSRPMPVPPPAPEPPAPEDHFE